jgi:copper homeostasis protein
MVELCVSSLTSINHALAGGVGRLELCRDLRVDGLTPDLPLLEYVSENAAIPVHVLIRPRAGAFVYSAAEVATMMEQIDLVKTYHLQGVVIGLLDTEGHLALQDLRSLCRYAEPLDLTFHRASDLLTHPERSLHELIDLGFHRVLSSGGAANALAGLDTLSVWREMVDDQLVIMPGGGINDRNADLFYQRGFKEIHLSAKSYNEEPMQIGMDTKEDPVADPTIIQKVVEINRSYGLD